MQKHMKLSMMKFVNRIFEMKNISLIGIVALLFTISSCDEDTGIVGSSITNNVDKFKIVADTFDVTSQSIRVDSVLSRSEYCYLGRIKDPETGAYITSNYMTQFTILEKEQGYMFPEEDVIGKSEKDGKLILVTAVNPTPAGEGKTTVSIGLGQAMEKTSTSSSAALIRLS